MRRRPNIHAVQGFASREVKIFSLRPKKAATDDFAGFTLPGVKPCQADLIFGLPLKSRPDILKGFMETCRLTIRAQPGARSDAVDGKVGEVIRVRLKAPAVEGKANRALLIFLAAKIGRRSRDLRLLTGEK